MAGFSVEDPVAFSNAIIEFMTKTSEEDNRGQRKKGIS
jgi:hypothetical protein